jgi:hypothetical protein
MDKLPYAEDVNYWQTGKSSPDTWIDNAQKEIRAIGGKIHGWAFGTQYTSPPRAAYMMEFELSGERFKVIWAVLPTRSGKNEASARIQAATMLYHDIKARCVSAKVIGKRTAFFSYLLLPDGCSVAHVATPELMNQLPEMFRIKQLTG